MHHILSPDPRSTTYRHRKFYRSSGSGQLVQYPVPQPGTRSSMSRAQCSTLCQQLKSLRHLEELLLTGNPVGSQGAQHLADSIQSWGVDHRLKSLYLWDCGIDTKGCVCILEALSFSQIQLIDISRNSIDGAFQAVGPNLVFPKLSQLDVAFVSLRKEDIRVLSISIRKRKYPI